ncbi:MAG TPA: hypothetical protein VF163_21510 [Micromonosporaceae bacterium]
MADSLADGRTRVAYVPAIANIAAPTTTELNAGILLHDVITPDGLVGFEASTADVPTDALGSEYDTVDVGRDSFSGTMLRLKKQSSGDTTYTTLGAKGVEGYIAIRRDMAKGTAWASSQALEVYPIKTGRRRNLPPEKNSVRKYEVPCKIWQEPNLDAAVA